MLCQFSAVSLSTDSIGLSQTILDHSETMQSSSKNIAIYTPQIYNELTKDCMYKSLRDRNEKKKKGLRLKENRVHKKCCLEKCTPLLCSFAWLALWWKSVSTNPKECWFWLQLHTKCIEKWIASNTDMLNWTVIYTKLPGDFFKAHIHIIDHKANKQTDIYFITGVKIVFTCWGKNENIGLMIQPTK